MIPKATARMQRILHPPAALGRPAGSGQGPPPKGAHFLDEEGWSVLGSRLDAPPADPLQGLLGRPGLWKLVRENSGRATRCVFELPPNLPAGEGDEPDKLGRPPLEDCLAWALRTAQGWLPDGWQPPPRADVEAWISPGGLTVQSGPVVLQAELIHCPDRLALRVPILPRLPADLPPARRQWLAELLLDAQDRWRMVRLGLSGGAALAEVDLSGCPPAVLVNVFQAGLGALRWAVEWLARPATFLADPACPCRAAEVFPVRA